jgi:hypothetical protein
MRHLLTTLSILAFSSTAMAGVVTGSGMVVLDTSASGALSMTGNSDVQVPVNSIYVNSNSPTAVKTTGTASIDTPNLYICGGFSFTGGSGCTGAVHPSVAPYTDPMAGLAFPSTTNMAQRSLNTNAGATVAAQPGYYPDGITITGNATVTFAPGVYVLNNDFKVTAGSLSGTGVVFVMQHGKVAISGCAAFTFTAPTAGDMQGVFMCQPSSNTEVMSLTGGSEMVIAGAIYTPGGKLSLTGNSGIAGVGPKMGDLVVAKQVSLTGTGAIKIGNPAMPAVQVPIMPLYD